MTHLNSAVDDHERALRGAEPDNGGYVLAYTVAALLVATGVLIGYGIGLLVLA